MNVDDKTLKAMVAALNFREMKQDLISSNVANANTPGFKAKKIDFEEALARAINLDGTQNLNAEDARHFNVGGGGFNNLEPEIYEDPNGIVSEDGNTVDVEAEMGKMAENKIMYDALVQLVNKKMGMMKYLVNTEK